MTVVTSNAKGASTDAGVGLVLIGTAGSSGPHTLDNGDGDAFKRGEGGIKSALLLLGLCAGPLLNTKMRAMTAGWMQHLHTVDTCMSCRQSVRTNPITAST